MSLALDSWSGFYRCQTESISTEAEVLLLELGVDIGGENIAGPDRRDQLVNTR